MRDFRFDPASPSDEIITGPEPVVMEEIVEHPAPDEMLSQETLDLQEMDRESLDETMSSSHRIHIEEDDESNNLPKLIGAAVVAVLVVGGGIYAYESSIANAPKQVAMKTPAPAASSMASNQPMPPEQNNAAPVHNAAPVAPKPAPVVKSASQTPAPEPAAPVQAAKAMTPGVGIGPTDDPNIDAPMTYTADNAPPPQKEGSSQVAVTPAPSRTLAAQQPLTAPNLNSPQSPSSAATNQSSGATAPSSDASSAAPALRPQPAVPPAQ